MRKIKITALILAVLMVMAAFAGCASKSTVEDLDSRVEALEGKIDANQKANEELLAEIKDLIAGNKSDSEKALTDAINGLKDLVNSNKETSDKALTDAINNLTALVNNNKTASDKALTDAINNLTTLVNNNKTASDKALADAIAAMTEAQKTLADAIAANKADSDKALADAIAALTTLVNNNKTESDEALLDAINGLKDLVNSNKETTDKALADAINALTTLVNNNKTESDKALADILAAIEKLNKDKADAELAAAALQAAKQEKAILLATAKATYEAKQVKYSADDYAAIVTAIATADIQIANANTIEEVNTIYAGVAGELAKYAQMDDYLYAQYLALKGNIVEANRAVAEAAYKYLTEVAQPKLGDALKEYKTGEKNDLGQDITVNLVAQITLFNGLYSNVDTFDGVATLKKVTADAEKLVKQIADIKTVVYGQYTKVTAAKAAYETFKANAKKLSEANYALITNVDVLTAADARMQQLEDASIAYVKLGNFVAAGNSGAYESVLKPLPTVAEPLYTTKAIYDAAMSKINAWAAEYNLDADNVKAIIADTSVDGKDYDAYLAAYNYVNEMVLAYQEFAKDIAPRVLALNKITALSSSAFAEYAAINEAIEEWALRVEEDLENDIEEVVVDEDNMFAIINDVLDLELDDTSAFVELFKFENDKNGVITTFFTTTFTAAMEAAEDIEDLLDAIDPETVTSVKELVAIRGNMKTNAAGNWVFLGEGDVAAAGTIEAFLETYVHVATSTDDLSYDLSVLLPMEKYEAKRAAVEANIAAQKASATALTKAYNAYLKAVADKFAAITAGGYTIAPGVTTTYEFKATVDKLVKDYKAWVANGGVSTMVDLVLVEDSTTEYEYVAILNPAVVTGIDAANKEINTTIAGAITKIETIYKALSTINTASAITVGKMTNKAITKVEAVKKTIDKEEVVVAYKVTYIKTADGKTGTAYVKDSISTVAKAVAATEFYTTLSEAADGTWELKTSATVPTVLQILEACEDLAANLLAVNAGQTVASVETLKLSNNFEAYKFKAIQSLALDALEDKILGADEAAIKAAKNVAQIANAIVNDMNLSGTTTEFDVFFNEKCYICISYAAGEYVVKTSATGAVAHGGI